MQQHREHASRVNLALESFWYVGGAEKAVSQRAKCFRRFFDPCFDIVVIRKVAVKKRAEIYKGFSEANGATAVKGDPSVSSLLS